jgi:hypothetical protein
MYGYKKGKKVKKKKKIFFPLLFLVTFGSGIQDGKNQGPG